METLAMSDLVKVRTIRPHDTTDGLRQPGDEYQRARTEAETLRDQGVLEIVATRATKAK
jgi:hypothetical protein